VAEALRTQARAEPEREIELLTEAVGLLEAGERRLEAAHAVVELGMALAREGRDAEAREPLRAGLDRADACGASALAARAREGLVAGGARPRRTRITGRESLTPAELRVARLAAEGHTNRQIAESLFVTVKAVKWHLGNVYRKLEIDSRDQLVDALGR
jgi:DNA-binding CsgD family transcriptional regulator